MNWNIKKNVVFSLLYQFIAACIGFVLPRFYIMQYGSAINGSIATISQITGFLGLLEAGMGSVASVAFYKCLAQKGNADLTVVRNTVRRYYRIIAAISISICVALSFLLPVFLDNSYSFRFNLELVLIVSCGYFIQYYLGITSQILLTADYKAYIGSISQTLAMLANFAVSVLLIKNGVDVRLVKLASALVLLIRPILLTWYVKKKYNFSDSKVFDNGLMKQRWNNLGQTLAFYIHNQTDMVIIMLFLSVKENSVYSLYGAIIAMVKTIIAAVTSNFNPVLGRELIDSPGERLQNIFKRFVMINNFLLNVLFAVTAVLIIPFMKLYSAEFDYNYFRAGFAYFFCLSEYIYLYRTPYNVLINVCGHFKETQISAFIEAGLNIVLSVIFVNIFGITGVILGTANAMMFRLIYCIVYVKKNLLQFKITDLIKSITLSMGSMLAVFAVLQLVDFSFVKNYFMFIVAGFLMTLLFAAVQLAGYFVIYRKELKERILKA